MWEVERLADPVHLGQSQFKASMRAQYSDSMFHGKTKEQNSELKKIFSKDVKSRCSMIVKQLMDTHSRQIDRICKDLPDVLKATLQCYDGDCSMCSRYSVVCQGGCRGNWWTRSKYLATYQITVLQMDDKDKYLLQEVLKMKLSENAINSMKLYDNTNKNEGVHRSMSVNLPKNVIHARNMAPRLASGVHRNNNMPGTSTRLKCQHAGIEFSERSDKFLKKMDADFKYKQDYEKRTKVKAERLKKSGEKLLEHKTYKDLNKKQPEYRKGQLDPQPPLQFHESYCKQRLPKNMQ